jgi:hypothetical protein
MCERPHARQELSGQKSPDRAKSRPHPSVLAVESDLPTFTRMMNFEREVLVQAVDRLLPELIIGSEAAEDRNA